MRKDKILYLENDLGVKYSIDSGYVHIEYEDGDFIFYLENPMTGDRHYKKLTPIYDTTIIRKMKIDNINKSGSK